MKEFLRYACVVLCCGIVLIAVSVITLPFAKNTKNNPSESGSSGISETEPNESDSSEADPSVLVYFEDDPDPSLTGLRAYFYHKLLIDPKKVEKYLNIREVPSEDGKILAVLFEGDLVSYIGKQGSWYLIVKDDVYGFVHEDYVLKDEDAYQLLKDRITFLAMATEETVQLYRNPDATNPCYKAAKSDSFPVIGVEKTTYKLHYDLNGYDEELYIPTDKALLYFAFRGANEASALSPKEEEILLSLNVYENLKKRDDIIAEAKQELEQYEAYLTKQSQEAASKRGSSAPTTPYVPPVKPEEPTKVSYGERTGTPYYSVNGMVCPYELQDYAYSLCVSFGVDWYYPYFLCLMYQESKFNQAARNYHPEDGTTDVGICQVKDRYHAAYKERFGHPEYDLFNNVYHNMYIGFRIQYQNLTYNGFQLVPSLNDYFYGTGASANGIWSDYPNHVLQWYNTMVLLN